MIKIAVLVIGIFVCSMAVFSQSDVTVNEKRINYGFNLGINHSILLGNEMLPSNASLSNNIGFSLGVLADFKASRFLLISPKAELSFNNSSVKFSGITGFHGEYEVMPISLGFMTHFIFKKNNAKLSPYFFFGPNVKIPVFEKNNNSTTFSTNPDFAIDLGIGFDRPFSRFNFSPEIRYSFGLLNVNQHPSLQTLNFHNVSLLFNFLEKSD